MGLISDWPDVKFIILVLISQLFYATKVQALGLLLRAEGGYYYSRLERQSTTSPFTLLADGATRAGGEVGLALGRFELFGNGSYHNAIYSAPSTRTVNNKSIVFSNYSAGLRIRFRPIWFFVKGESRDGLAVIPDSTGNVFELKKGTTQFIKAGIRMFGDGPGYRISLEGEAGTPLADGKIDTYDTKYNYVGQGFARVEFGSALKIGIYVGGGAEQYKADTQYFRTDFSAGLSLTIDGAGSQSDGKDSGSGGAHRYPL